MGYPKIEVSTKLALYSHDLTSVLVMRYPIRGRIGLPGGHVELRESPDDAIKRELVEELALVVNDMKRKDFFLREGRKGPIILAYTAVASEGIDINPTNPRFEYAEWVAKDDIENIAMSPEYIRFVLENWPNE
jgi:8-oxo-dGTP pyrophosphatase MutT (NUDIX family)